MTLKRALIFSLIFHIILFSIAFFFKEQKKAQEPDYLYTRIITPDELKRLEPPAADLQTPEKLFQQRTQPSLKTERGKPSADSKTSPPKRIQPDKRKIQELAQIKKSQAGQPLLPEKQTVIPDSLVGKDDSLDKGASKKQLSEPSPAKPFDKFDKDVIGKLAQKEKEKKPDSSITFSTKEYQYQGYMQRLKEKIEGIWKYPTDAAQRGIYGDLYIRFTIKKDGRLGAVDLIRTSGYKSLDDAALRALRDAEPYWPLPDEWGRDGLTITGHFVYTHYGSYIR